MSSDAERLKAAKEYAESEMNRLAQDLVRFTHLVDQFGGTLPAPLAKVEEKMLEQEAAWNAARTWADEELGKL